MDLHLNKKQIRRVILLKRDEEGTLAPITLWKARKKKKKTSRQLRGADRTVRSAAKGYKVFGDTLVKRHRRSNRKRKDGGIRDLGANIFRASRKASKAAR